MRKLFSDPCLPRYATVELKCLAIQCAFHKCCHYLVGMSNFRVDHRSLRSTCARGIQKPLYDIENALFFLGSQVPPPPNIARNCLGTVSRSHGLQERLILSQMLCQEHRLSLLCRRMSISSMSFTQSQKVQNWLNWFKEPVMIRNIR